MALDSYQATGTIREDGLELSDLGAWANACAEFVRGPVVVMMQSATAAEVRSLQANRYLWKLLTLMGQETGDSKDVMYDLMRERFLSYTYENVDPLSGEVTLTKLSKGTSRLSSKEFSAFVNEVKLFAQEWLGMDVPDQEAA